MSHLSVSEAVPSRPSATEPCRHRRTVLAGLAAALMSTTVIAASIVAVTAIGVEAGAVHRVGPRLI